MIRFEAWGPTRETLVIIMRVFVPEEQQRTGALHLLLTMGGFSLTPLLYGRTPMNLALSVKLLNASFTIFHSLSLGTNVHETFPFRHHLEGFCYVHLHQYRVTMCHMSGPIPHLPCHLKVRTFLQSLNHCILTHTKKEGLALSALISSFVMIELECLGYGSVDKTCLKWMKHWGWTPKPFRSSVELHVMPAFWMRKQDNHNTKVPFSYIASSRPGWDTWKPVYKNKTVINNKKN